MIGFAPVSVAAAAPDLTISQAHSPAKFAQGQNDATFTITVANQGTDPTSGAVTVTDAFPAGLTYRTTSASGWSCSGSATRTCTRSGALASGASYPPIVLTVTVSTSPPAQFANPATVAGGGDATPANNSSTESVAVDACPYGWSPEGTVWFAPPSRPGRPGGIDSGVRNPERGDGCTLMDAIWNAEPFADHAAFVARVTQATADFMAAGLLSLAERDAVQAAAAQSEVGGPTDRQLDNSCQNRIAFTFDDGTSGYRPATLQVLRDKQVHANFFDNGFRVAANPQWARFQVREGHIELNHTYSHIHMDEMSDAGNREEVLRNEAFLASVGAPLTFTGIRPPFGGSNAGVQATLNSMGYTYFLNRIDASDWLPDKSAEAIRDDILRQLRPGVIIALHDGPADTPAGAATVAALGMIIDRTREQGYCFGVIDHTGMVVADRYVSSGEPIPPIVNPIPYHALAFGTTEQIPQPFVYDLGPLTITAAHSPSLLVHGGSGTLTLTVTNDGDAPTDGETVIVTDAIPAGLTATSASGTGWTCTGTATRRCTRTDVLAPHASYPPIAIAVNASATAPGVIDNRATVLGHGEAWNRTATDTFSVGVPASGDVSGAVPATLALSLGAPGSFGGFVPGIDREYTATTTANVISTAGDAALSVSDPGHLANGTFALPETLRVEIAPASWTGPVSNAAAAITFRQHIGAGDALRTGNYSKTLTFTLSTQTP